MGAGAGIVIVAVGAVLRFAVDASNSHGFNIHTIGVILMVAGAVIALIDLAYFLPRRRRVSQTVTTRPTGGGYVQDQTVRRDDYV